MLLTLLICLICAASFSAQAHPEDEICGPNSGVDPALCRQLADIDRAATGFATAEATATVPYFETAKVYFKIGLDHVFPNGLDHMIFVFAIILSARRFLPAVGMVSLFTLAHAVAIAFASLGIINWGGPWLEVFIAVTIFWAGVECVLYKDPPPWRAAMIFAFGLVHGLGLAGAIVDRGLPEGQFFTAFFAFNFGIEFAQLGCALVGLGVVKALSYIRRLPIQKSGGFAVATFGLFWTLERVWFAIV